MQIKTTSSRVKKVRNQILMGTKIPKGRQGTNKQHGKKVTVWSKTRNGLLTKIALRLWGKADVRRLENKSKRLLYVGICPTELSLRPQWRKSNLYRWIFHYGATGTKLSNFKLNRYCKLEFRSYPNHWGTIMTSERFDWPTLINRKRC